MESHLITVRRQVRMEKEETKGLDLYETEEGAVTLIIAWHAV